MRFFRRSKLIELRLPAPPAPAPQAKTDPPPRRRAERFIRSQWVSGSMVDPSIVVTHDSDRMFMPVTGPSMTIHPPHSARMHASPRLTPPMPVVPQVQPVARDLGWMPGLT